MSAATPTGSVDAADEYAAHVARLVASAPPLTEHARDVIARAFRGRRP